MLFRSNTNWNVSIGVGKTCAAHGKLVEIWCLYDFVAVATEDFPSVLVSHEDQLVRYVHLYCKVLV